MTRAAKRREGAANGGDVLVAHHTQDQRGAAVAAVFLVPGVGEAAGGGGVVRAVEDDLAVLQPLEAARPLDLREAGAAGFLGGRDPAGIQRGEGEGGVEPLVRARQGERPVGWEGIGDDAQRRTLLGGNPRDDGGGLRLLRRADHGDAGLDDPGFLARDGLQGVAQPGHVVEVDGGQDGDGGA